MKKVVYVIIVLLIFIVFFGCATTPKIKEEKEGVKPETFFQSVESGDFAEVKRLIEAGADVNAQENDGSTALMWASLEGHAGITRLLIEAGADVNAQDNYGYIALIYTSRKGHTEVVKLLIEEGADVNAKDNDVYINAM